MKKVLSTLVGASALATGAICFNVVNAEAASLVGIFSGNDTGNNGTAIAELESAFPGTWTLEGKSDEGFGSFVSGGDGTLSGVFSTGLTGAGAFSVKAGTGYSLYTTSDISEFSWSTVGLVNGGGNQPGLSHLSIFTSPTYNPPGNNPIPEPLTILGAGAAISFGTAFKRKLGKAKKNDKKA